MHRLRVGIVTMQAMSWELEDNFQRMEAYVCEAVRRRAQLVIAPVVANTWSAVMIDRSGEILLEKCESECVSVQRLELSKPTKEQRTRFMERRPDLYAPLTKSFEEERYYDDQGRTTPLAERFGEEHRKKLKEKTK